MTAATVMTAACAVSLLGAVGVMPVCRNRRLAGQVNLAVTVLAGLLAAGASLAVLVSGAGRPVTLWPLPEYASAIRIHLDGLSAVFVLLIACVAAAAAVYSIDYLAHYPDYGLLRYYPAFQLFLAGMYAIVIITDLMVGFFLCWQLMTFASYALIRFERRVPQHVRAANRYLLAMQAAGLLILLGSGLLAHGPVVLPGGETLMRYDFDAISHGMPGLLRSGSGLATAGLLCFLLGFGIKAGMWPFGQWWLPAAHPAAPSPVSALLSGVMIKTGVYGLMRSFLWLIPAEAAVDYPSDVWGLVIGGLGTVTLFIGTTQALGQDQSKRLLAYSSIGQVGYILLALGAAVALLPRASGEGEMLVLAVAAFSAAVFHTVNHGLYKSLLFLNAGSLLAATDTQDLNQMGGLARHLPWTAATALIGSLAIAGVPLLNGFASKWSIFIATMLGARYMPYLTVCAVIAMFTSVLTLALFLKFFGVSFLGRASRRVTERSAAGRTVEVGWGMRGPQLALAGGCLLLGLVPQLGYWIAYRAIQTSGQGLVAAMRTVPPLPTAAGTGVVGPAGLALLAPLPVAVVFGLLLALAVAISVAGGAPRRRVEPWLCGYAAETEQMRYRARHFYREVLRYFPWVHPPAAPPNGTGKPLPAGAASTSAQEKG
jgi:formate hydrogenlyase subunit 3/multisubunit Na+/H+ antiporter MnhD subunit